MTNQTIRRYNSKLSLGEAGLYLKRMVEQEIQDAKALRSLEAIKMSLLIQYKVTASKSGIRKKLIALRREHALKLGQRMDENSSRPTCKGQSAYEDK